MVCDRHVSTDPVVPNRQTSSITQGGPDKLNGGFSCQIYAQIERDSRNAMRTGGLLSATAVPEQHKGAVCTIGVLLVCVLAGMDYQATIHYRARALGIRLEDFHWFDEHLAVVRRISIQTLWPWP